MFSNPDLLEYKKALLGQPYSIKTNKTLLLRFHEIELLFVGENSFLNSLENYYSAFVTTKHSSRNFVTVYCHPVPLEKARDWDNETLSDLFYENRHTGDIAIQRDFAAKFLREKSEVYLYCDQNIGDGIHNFLRWFLSLRLIHNKKAFLHSSCVLLRNQKAYFFMGPSGAGKTTITKLSKPRDYLGDDMNIISLESNLLKAYPGAVGGLLSPTTPLYEGYQVGGLYWIKQAKHNRIETTSKVRQYQYLISSLANLPWKYLSIEDQEKVTIFCQHILEHIDLKVLYFEKAPTFWELVEREIEC